MIYFTIFIPIITIVVLLLFFKSKTTILEYALVAVPSILFIIILNTIMIQYNTSDTEYLGNYIKSVRYYEPWNEYIKITCSRTHKLVKTTYTTYYYCSYIDYHRAYWVKIDSYDNQYEISNNEYVFIKNKF